jgi:hypothetical protein
MYHDIKKYDNNHKILEILWNFNNMFQNLNSERKIIKEACRIAVEEMGYDYAWFSYMNSNSGKTISHSAQIKKGNNKNISAAPSLKDSPDGKLLQKAETVQEYSSEVFFASWKENLPSNAPSTIILPVICANDTIGIFCVSANEINPYNNSILLDDLVNDLGHGINQIRIIKENLKKISRNVIAIKN